MQLTYDRGPAASQVAAVLVLDAVPDGGLEQVCAAVAERIEPMPRLRQRLWRTPPGCGRPVWVDDPGFDVRRHVTAAACPAPGDEPALLDLAARIATRALPWDRPLWSAVLVSGLAGGRAAMVVVLHHVVTDGVGGLAVLAGLVDGAPRPPAPPFPAPPPSVRDLARDAMRARGRAFAQLPSSARRLRDAAAELRLSRLSRAPGSSLNRPVGPRRRLAVVRADLAAARGVAHEHAATVNDVVLTAVAGALRAVLGRRGEDLDTLVVSVPVSGRPVAGSPGPGNQVGAFPVSVPAAGDPWARLERTAAATRARKAGARGASAAVLEPVFRGLAAVHLAGRLIDHQRLVNTFVTNLRGPGERLRFLACEVAEVIAVSAAAGNASVVFAVLSYAGTLRVTMVADADLWPDLDELATQLQRQLDLLTRRPATGVGSA